VKILKSFGKALAVTALTVFTPVLVVAIPMAAIKAMMYCGMEQDYAFCITLFMLILFYMTSKIYTTE